jgi:hypothetical protein
MVEVEEALADSYIQQEFARPIRKQRDEVSFLSILAF